MRKDASWTIRRREAYESLSEVMRKHHIGACDEQAVKDELFKFRDTLLAPLEMHLRRARRARDWGRAKRPKMRGVEHIDLPPEPRTPVLHTQIHRQAKRRQAIPDLIPKRFRFVQAICLYLYRQKGARTLEDMAVCLDKGGVRTAAGEPWTAEMLREELNPSEVWTLLRG